jgi:hypothetical protein
MNLLAAREAQEGLHGQVHHMEVRDVLDLASRTLQMEPPSLARRASSQSTTCSSSSASDTCQKPTDSSVTLPITLGVAYVLQ